MIKIKDFSPKIEVFYSAFDNKIITIKIVRNRTPLSIASIPL
jgi:hypothetical protein